MEEMSVLLFEHSVFGILPFSEFIPEVFPKSGVQDFLKLLFPYSDRCHALLRNLPTILAAMTTEVATLVGQDSESMLTGYTAVLEPFQCHPFPLISIKEEPLSDADEGEIVLLPDPKVKCSVGARPDSPPVGVKTRKRLSTVSSSSASSSSSSSSSSPESEDENPKVVAVVPKLFKPTKPAPREPDSTDHDDVLVLAVSQSDRHAVGGDQSILK